MRDKIMRMLELNFTLCKADKCPRDRAIISIKKCAWCTSNFGMQTKKGGFKVKCVERLGS